ncbi:MAG TPA: hypothetical protein VF806_07830 [Anaerolineaceae bacterium]
MDTKESPWLMRIVIAVLAVFLALSLGFFAYDNYRAGSEPWQIAVSSLILAIPLVLFYGSVGVLVKAWRERRSQGQISPRIAKYVYFTPRIAGILIAIFLGLFALDVFDMEGGFWEKVGAFLIHAMPAILLLVVAALAWRWEWIGVVAFLIAAVFFLRTLIFNPLQSLGMLVLFSGPMATIAALFWASWKWRGSANKAVSQAPQA